MLYPNQHLDQSCSRTESRGHLSVKSRFRQFRTQASETRRLQGSLNGLRSVVNSASYISLMNLSRIARRFVTPNQSLLGMKSLPIECGISIHSAAIAAV